MTEITQQTLDKIKKENICPRPRWYFSARNYLFWSLAGASTLVGGIAVSTIFFILDTHDWQAHDYANHGSIERAILVLPYFWVMILAAFAAVAYVEFRQTKYGYRTSRSYVVLGSMAASIVLGSALYYGGGEGYEAHDLMNDNIPYYGAVIYTNEDLWESADHGLLGGFIVNATGTDFVLRDSQGRSWVVHATSVGESIVLGSVGKKVKLFGDLQNEDTFGAYELMPWKNLAPKSF